MEKSKNDAEDDVHRCLSKANLVKTAGFKLPVTYVTKQLVAIQNCNSTSALDELNRFCETYHAGQYKIYIISGEENAVSDPRIETILMAKDSPMTMDGMIRLSSNLGRWLHASPENVAVITSPAELERSVFVTAFYMLHSHMLESTDQVLARLATVIRGTKSAVSTDPPQAAPYRFSPSQIRFLESYETVVRHKFDLQIPRIELTSVRIDHPDPASAVELRIEFRDGGRDGPVIFSGNDSLRVRQQFALIEFPNRQTLTKPDLFCELYVSWTPALSNSSSSTTTSEKERSPQQNSSNIRRSAAATPSASSSSGGGSSISSSNSSNQPYNASRPTSIQKPPQRVQFWFSLHALRTDARSRYFGKTELDGPHLDWDDILFHEGFGVEFFYQFLTDALPNNNMRRYQLLALRQSRRIFRPTAKFARELAAQTKMQAATASSSVHSAIPPLPGASSNTSSRSSGGGVSTSTSSTIDSPKHKHRQSKKEEESPRLEKKRSKHKLKKENTIRLLFDRAMGTDLRSSSTGSGHTLTSSSKSTAPYSPSPLPSSGPIVSSQIYNVERPELTSSTRSPKHHRDGSESSQTSGSSLGEEKKDKKKEKKEKNKSKRNGSAEYVSGTSSASSEGPLMSYGARRRAHRNSNSSSPAKSASVASPQLNSLPVSHASTNTPASAPLHSVPIVASATKDTSSPSPAIVSASSNTSSATSSQRASITNESPSTAPAPVPIIVASGPLNSVKLNSGVVSESINSTATTDSSPASSALPSPSSALKPDTSSTGSNKSGVELGPGGVSLVSPSQRLLELRTVFHEGPLSENAWQLDPAEVRKVKLISNGATALVYKGFYRNQRVAIKEFLGQFEAFREAFEEVKKEFTVISTIKSPYVMYFFGALMKPNLAMVVEYCSKGSLFDVMNDGTERITWRRVIRAAQDIALGIGCLHNWKPPIVHRDLKSLNLLVDKHWTVKVGDFGSSRFTYRMNGQLLTTLGRMRGTFTYTPPELFNGELFTIKGDIYAYGIVLWEMATRCLLGRYEYPYADTKYFTNQFQILMQAAQKGLRPTMRAGIPESFQKLIRSCWAQKPEDRPNDGEIGKTLKVIEREYALQRDSSECAVRSARGDKQQLHPSHMQRIPGVSATSTSSASSSSSSLSHAARDDTKREISGSSEDTRFADAIFMQNENDDDEEDDSSSSSSSSDSSSEDTSSSGSSINNNNNNKDLSAGASTSERLPPPSWHL